VYAATAQVGLRKYATALSVSSNPTFAGKAITVEAHLLDFSGELYGHVVELDVLSWLRDTMKFGGVEQLKRQLERDTAGVRAMCLPVE
jgi:riboflavin kinase/FMN adenylyltransferase